MEEILYTEKQIDEILTHLAAKLNEDYKDAHEPIVILSVLKGAAAFTNDLVKKLNFPIIMDYVQVSSYQGTSSTGIIHMKKDLTVDIDDRRVIIFEDIIDTGRTMRYLKDYLSIRHKPKELKVCTFIDKKPMRVVDFEADYVGIELNENKFICGYGFDYNELVRNVPYIFVPDEKELKEWDELTSFKK